MTACTSLLAICSPPLPRCPAACPLKWDGILHSVAEADKAQESKAEAAGAEGNRTVSGKAGADDGAAGGDGGGGRQGGASEAADTHQQTAWREGASDATDSAAESGKGGGAAAAVAAPATTEKRRSLSRSLRDALAIIRSTERHLKRRETMGWLSVEEFVELVSDENVKV